MLVVIGGLPGTGKTTAAKVLAARRSATYLRIDVIEQAIRTAGSHVGATGYAVANALAEANLALGLSVVVDCVNPVAESRQAWRTAAARVGSILVEVELVCSDSVEHRARLDGRVNDIPGLPKVGWQDVLAHDHVAWTEPHFVLDTAGLDEAAVVPAIGAVIDAADNRPDDGQ